MSKKPATRRKKPATRRKKPAKLKPWRAPDSAACVVCGRPLEHGRAVTCGSKCRQKKYRESKRGGTQAVDLDEGGASIGDREAAAWDPERAASIAPELPEPACAATPLRDPADALRNKQWKADPEFDEAERFWRQQRLRYRAGRKA